MQGVPFVLDAATKAKIVKAASRGLLQQDIARVVGLTPQHFSDIKKKYPEINDLLEQGRSEGAEKLIDMSWEIIEDKRDAARTQELNRLHRKLKTEEPEGTGTGEADGITGGFEVVIRKKSDVQPT